MFVIKKISQRYNIQEDRLQFTIQNESSEIINLWVTRRIANLLVRVLADHCADFSTKLEKDKPINYDGVQEKKESAVPYEPSKESGLVHTFNLSFKANKTDIVFRWGVTGSASIGLDDRQLRDFFRGLFSLFAIATWSKESFPKDLKIHQYDLGDAALEKALEDFDIESAHIPNSKSLH